MTATRPAVVSLEALIVARTPNAQIASPSPGRRAIGATGGVEATESSLRQWFGAGIVACGIGSNLITKKLLDARDYKGIEENVRTTVQLVKTIKADLAAKR